MSRVTPDLPFVTLSHGERASVLQNMIDDEIRTYVSWGEMPGAMSSATVEACRDIVARRVAALEAARQLFAGFHDLDRAERLCATATQPGRA